MAPLECNLYGHPLAKIAMRESRLGERLYVRECLYVYRQAQLFLSVYVNEFKMVGRKISLSPKGCLIMCTWVAHTVNDESVSPAMKELCRRVTTSHMDNDLETNVTKASQKGGLPAEIIKFWMSKNTTSHRLLKDQEVAFFVLLSVKLYHLTITVFFCV